MSGELSARHVGQQVGQQVRQSARQARPWLVAAGRIGFAAKGLQYALIGALAARVAAGRGGETTDQQGALVHLAQAPFGRFLLLATAVGFGGYALWRFLQALFDTDNKGRDAKGLASRVVYAGIGVAHLLLAASAIGLLRTGSAGKGSTAMTRDWTARLLGAPFGRWLVIVAGLVGIGAGVYQFVKAAKATFRGDLRLDEMGAATERWVVLLGRAGFAARGVVFGLIGLFLVIAAWHVNPGEARGLDGALATLAAQPFGPWLLGVVALGFVAYGLFLFALVRYRRIVIV